MQNSMQPVSRTERVRILHRSIVDLGCPLRQFQCRLLEMTAARRDVEEKRVVVGDSQGKVDSQSFMAKVIPSIKYPNVPLFKQMKTWETYFSFFHRDVQFHVQLPCNSRKIFSIFCLFFFLHADANKNIDATWGYLSGR